jgi:hypothetical protein
MKVRGKGGKIGIRRVGKKVTKNERQKSKNQRKGMSSQNFVVGTASLSSTIKKTSYGDGFKRSPDHITCAPTHKKYNKCTMGRDFEPWLFSE